MLFSDTHTPDPGGVSRRIYCRLCLLLQSTVWGIKISSILNEYKSYKWWQMFRDVLHDALCHLKQNRLHFLPDPFLQILKRFRNDYGKPFSIPGKGTRPVPPLNRLDGLHAEHS